MSLYFIALLPPEKIRSSIKAFKLEIADKYNARHALKLPAHITLQPPIKLEITREKQLEQVLENFCVTQRSFELKLNGFGSFPPRVIFAQVRNKQPVIELHDALQKALRENDFLKGNKTPDNFHPHVTIATRDLDPESFSAAWTHFEAREFKVSFAVESFFLLKHTGKSWEIYKEFLFN